MTNPFKHPLARDAKVWSTGGVHGTSIRVLVVITTLELDAGHKGFKADKVGRLSEAAKTWVQENSADASDFVLVNRPKDWD